jgi:hypothetical protein
MKWKKSFVPLIGYGLTPHVSFKRECGDFEEREDGEKYA